MFLNIWAFITRQEVVYLLDYDGEVTKTVAKQTPFGGLTAKRHWPFNIRNVGCTVDGVVNGSYVEDWCYPNGKKTKA
jgi:hypothetical protein